MWCVSNYTCSTFLSKFSIKSSLYYRKYVLIMRSAMSCYTSIQPSYSPAIFSSFNKYITIVVINSDSKKKIFGLKNRTFTLPSWCWKAKTKQKYCMKYKCLNFLVKRGNNSKNIAFRVIPLALQLDFLIMSKYSKFGVDTWFFLSNGLH